MTYVLRDNPGCVVVEVEAVQFRGNPDDILAVFPNVGIYQAVSDGAITVTDDRATYLAMGGDWVIGVPGENRVMILGDAVFQKTYRKA